MAGQGEEEFKKCETLRSRLRAEEVMACGGRMREDSCYANRPGEKERKRKVERKQKVEKWRMVE